MVSFERAVAQTLEERIRLLWGEHSANGVAGRIAYDGFDPDPEWTGQRHAKFAVEWAEAEPQTTSGLIQDGIAGATYRHTGTLLAFVLGPAGDGIGGDDVDGMRSLIEAVGALSTVFRGWANPDAPPQIWMQAPAIRGAPSRQGAYMQIGWACPFIAFGNFNI